MQQIVLPDCPPPYYALAHSMGGAVMLRLAHAGRRWFDRMVLSAPMIDLPGRSMSLPARVLVRAMRWTGQGGNYVPGGNAALTGTIKTPDGAELRSRAGRRRRAARARSASSPAAPSRSRNISRRCATCATAALRWR